METLLAAFLKVGIFNAWYNPFFIECRNFFEQLSTVQPLWQDWVGGNVGPLFNKENHQPGRILDSISRVRLDRGSNVGDRGGDTTTSVPCDWAGAVMRKPLAFKRLKFGTYGFYTLQKIMQQTEKN